MLQKIRPRLSSEILSTCEYYRGGCERHAETKQRGVKVPELELSGLCMAVFMRSCWRLRSQRDVETDDGNGGSRNNYCNERKKAKTDFWISNRVGYVGIQQAERMVIWVDDRQSKRNRSSSTEPMSSDDTSCKWFGIQNHDPVHII